MSIDILSSCYFGGLKLSFNDRMALMVSTSVYWVPLTAAFTEASDTRIKGLINFSLKNRLDWNYNLHSPPLNTNSKVALLQKEGVVCEF